MTYWLRCRITPGQFTGEYAVSARQFDGRGFSLFAPEEYVRCDIPPTESQASEGWIRVQIYKQEDDLFIVRLPQETLENGYYVTVRRDQIRPQMEGQLIR